MEYMLFICTDSTAPTTEPTRHTIDEWVAETTEGGTRRYGDRLRPANDATTVKLRGGRLSVTAGPFAETTEWIAGYDVIECGDLDAAIEIAARHPMAQHGQIEIRPMWPIE
ncbi:MAG: hypothetical protein H7201_11000 [Candidatus Saccharibacteria bacterium]|nr:hypothetical protein [Microbacteriaceae bacterium]